MKPFYAGVQPVYRLPTKHAQHIVLSIIYLHCFKVKGMCGRVGLGMDIKKSLKPHE